MIMIVAVEIELDEEDVTGSLDWKESYNVRDEPTSKLI